MFIRKISRIVRGKTTPFQVFAACLLAGLLGFMPGFAQAPGLILLFTTLLVILNANLALAALVGVAAKLLSLLLMPLSFAVGRFLLDGPAQSLFATIINAPVLAWFGFEYYATTGGLAIGALVGLFSGWLTVRALQSLRKKMGELEKGSERYQKFTARKSVRFLSFVFLPGDRGKSTYEELVARKVGNPIRPLGVVLVVLTALLVVLIQMFAGGPIATMAVQSALERANGATVDLESADLNLKENRLQLTGLAMADPSALDLDLLRADRIEADFSVANLLRKRLELDRLHIRDASHGLKRHVPGKRLTPLPEPPAPTTEEKTIDDYLRTAKEWKERLAQIKRWLEKISGPEKAGEKPAEREETIRERLEREIREKGYARVAASHLVEGKPTLTIAELLAEKVRVPDLEEETLDITAKNLSTHPRLLGRSPELAVRSSGQSIRFDATLSALADEGATNRFDLALRGFSTDRFVSKLKLTGDPLLRGGTYDVSARGILARDPRWSVNLPLEITLSNATVSIAGGDDVSIDRVQLPIQVSGPIDNPRINVEAKAFADNLLRAGGAQAVDRLKQAAREKLGDAIGEKPDGPAAEDLGETGKALLKGLLDRPKK